MRILLVVLATLIFVITGCATTPVSPSTAKPVASDRLFAFQERTQTTNATVVVTRDKGFLGSGCYLSFFLSGTHAARFDVGETAQFHVEPGEILLRSGPDLMGQGLCGFGQDYWMQRETTLRAGETKHFRLSIGPPLDIQRGDPQ